VVSLVNPLPQRVGDAADQLVDRHRAVGDAVERGALAHRGAAEGDVHAADQLVDDDGAVAVAVADEDRALELAQVGDVGCCGW
jgi:hypothetical protein